MRPTPLGDLLVNAGAGLGPLCSMHCWNPCSPASHTVWEGEITIHYL